MKWRLKIVGCVVMVGVGVGVVDGTEHESIADIIDSHHPGQGTAAVRMWQYYLPHKVTGEMLGEQVHIGFVTEAHRIGLSLGFNASTGRCAYEGPGAYDDHIGPMFVTPSGLWEDGDNDVMSVTTPTEGSAILRKITIQNIDNERNMLCPCNHGVCIDLGPRLPPVCSLRFEDIEAALDGDDEFADDILVNIIILVVLVGLVALVRAGQ